MARYRSTAASLTGAVLGLALAAGVSSGAQAGTVNFTWDPSVTGNTTAGSFTANRFGLNDWATIQLPTNPTVTGSVTETGFLEISGFTNNGLPVSTVDTSNGTLGYGMYEAFSATSHLTCSGSGNCTGEFDSITATLYLYSTQHGFASYSFDASGNVHMTLPSGANPVALATESGPAGPVANFANITSGVPGASVGVNFNPILTSFFQAPPLNLVLDLEQVFSNTTGVVGGVPSKCPTSGALPCTIEIKGGGGNGDFLVPEPASLALFSVGLAAFGFVRRRLA
jgi:hypothetical protein